MNMEHITINHRLFWAYVVFAGTINDLEQKLHLSKILVSCDRLRWFPNQPSYENHDWSLTNHPKLK